MDQRPGERLPSNDGAPAPPAWKKPLAPPCEAAANAGAGRHRHWKKTPAEKKPPAPPAEKKPTAEQTSFWSNGDAVLSMLLTWLGEEADGKTDVFLVEWLRRGAVDAVDAYNITMKVARNIHTYMHTYIHTYNARKHAHKQC